MTGTANFLQSLGWAVLNSLWQLALLWICYQVITGIARKMSSPAKSALASGLLIAGFAWFAYTFFSVFGQSNTAEAISSSSLVNGQLNPELNTWLQRSLPVASVTYLLLLILPLLHFIRNYRYVQVIRKFGLSKIEPQWRIFVKNIAAHMGIRREVKVWMSEYISSPVTIGFLKPIILVPVAAVNHLTPQQLEAVLLHELAHIRRFDYLLNLVLHFIQSILYFNPFAKAFLKIVEKEREKSCDEMVLQFQYDSHEYATALLTLEKAGRQSRVFTMAANGKKADFLTRIELILGVHKKETFSFNRLAGFMAGLLCVIALNAILIISKPVNAHKTSAFAELRHLNELFRKPAELTSAKESPAPVPETTETESAVVNHIDLDRSDDPEETIEPKVSAISPASFVSYAFDKSAFVPAALIEEMAPQLNEQQKREVSQAIDASKKIIASTQWKLVEKNIGDVFTGREKEELKNIYHQQLQKIDWDKWENKLAYAYNTADWEKINLRLKDAVTEIKLDSIQSVYNEAICKISDVQAEMEALKMESIPDTQYDLELLEQKKSELKKELNRVKVTRLKKVVHL